MKSILPRTALPVSRKELLTALGGLLQFGNWSRENVTEFENELAEYLQVKHTLAFNSGRTALYAALQALNLQPADEIIVPAYVCAIVFEVILRLGLKPVLVDVDVKTFNINPELIPKSITKKTKAIIPVHLFGRPSQMDAIAEIAQDKGLFLIEDCAQALGAEYKGTKVGQFGDLAIFSFGPGKSITSGEGGVVAVNNAEFLEKIESAQNDFSALGFGWRAHSVRNVLAMKILSNPKLYGFIRGRLERELDERETRVTENCEKLIRNSHASELHQTVKLGKMPVFSASIGREQLRRIEQLNDKRRSNAAALSKSLNEVSDLLALPQAEKSEKSTFTRYPVRILRGSRDAIWRKMIEQGMDSERPYNYLADYLSSVRIDAPNASLLATSTLTIPNHPLLEEEDIDKTANALRIALRLNQ